MTYMEPVCKKHETLLIDVKADSTLLNKITLAEQCLHVNRLDLFRYIIDKLYCELMSKDNLKK